MLFFLGRLFLAWFLVFVCLFSLLSLLIDAICSFILELNCFALSAVISFRANLKASKWPEGCM